MKLYPEDERKIIAFYNDGYTQRVIAEHFGVTHGRISQILKKHGVKKITKEII